MGRAWGWGGGSGGFAGSKSRERVGGTIREGFPVPAENLTGVPNNKLKALLSPRRADHPTVL